MVSFGIAHAARARQCSHVSSHVNLGLIDGTEATYVVFHLKPPVCHVCVLGEGWMCFPCLLHCSQVPLLGIEALWRAELSAVASGKLSWNAWLCIVQPAAALSLCGTELVFYEKYLSVDEILHVACAFSLPGDDTVLSHFWYSVRVFTGRHLW